MKKILIVTPLYPPQIGGPANVAVFLENNLPSDLFRFRLVKFSSFLRFPRIIRHVLFAISLFKKVWWSEVVLVLDPVSVGYPIMLICRMLGKPYVLRVPGDYAWEQGVSRFGVTDLLDDFVEKDKKQFHQRVQKMWQIQSRVAQNAVAVIAQNQYLKRIITTWGVSDSQIQIISNPFNPVERVLTKTQARIDLGLEPQTKIIFSAGRLVEWKGFEKLLDAFDTLRIETKQLYIAGDGPQKSDLQQYIKEKNLENEVHLLGRLDKNILYKYIQASDCFVLNTAYEGVSNQLLEVASLMTPILTTNMAGNAEWLKHQHNALIFEYNNTKQITTQLDHILSDSNLAESLTQNAFKTLDFHDSKKIINLYTDLFKKVQ